MIRAAILALPLLVPFAASASDAFDPNGYVARIVLRKGDFPLVTATATPDLTGRFSIESSSTQQYVGKVSKEGDKVTGAETSEVRTGFALGLRTRRDGDALLLEVDGGARLLDRMDSYGEGPGRIELPSLTACSFTGTVKATRQGDAWHAVIKRPDCGIDADVTVMPART